MQLRLIILCLIVGLVVCGTTVDMARAGPFEKAGLSKSAGKVLTDRQADKVRGGFGGDRAQMQEVMAAVLASLGYADRDALHTAFQSGTVDREAMRDAMSTAMTDLGITPPTGGFTRSGSKTGPPAGVDRARFRSRRGFSSRQGFTARRDL